MSRLGSPLILFALTSHKGTANPRQDAPLAQPSAEGRTLSLRRQAFRQTSNRGRAEIDSDLGQFVTQFGIGDVLEYVFNEFFLTRLTKR